MVAGRDGAGRRGVAGAGPVERVVAERVEDGGDGVGAPRVERRRRGERVELVPELPRRVGFYDVRQRVLEARGAPHRGAERLP